MIRRPERWDVAMIRKFMVLFGLVSSIFDCLTFAVLHLVVHATPELFRTGWFVESVLTELLIALVVRTRRPILKSRPSTMLAALAFAVAGLTLLLPYVPLSQELFGFVPLPGGLLGLILGITALYVLTCEGIKHVFFRWGAAAG
jgi:Mg2+-importing ATPase